MIKSQQFITYKDMTESAVNWEHHCSYQLTSQAHHGTHHAIQLPSMQLSYTEREGGMMYETSSPPNAFSIAVILYSNDKACLDSMKLKAGYIFFLDHNRFYTFMSNSHIKAAIISLPEDQIKPPLKTLLTKKLFGHYMQDTQGKMSKILEDVLAETLAQKKYLKNEETYYERKSAKIISLLIKLINTQQAKIPKLTKGEKIALDIRERLYGHMDAKISIEGLAEQYKVSERTLQNAFTSLFGFTPKHFLQLMKLNHVHHELRESSVANSSVSRIAIKWGFAHMGSFSQYYSSLFGQNPSVTLQTDYNNEGAMTKECAERQEEME